MTGSHRPFADWLATEIRRRGYDLDARGEQARFARDAGLNPGIVSRLLRGGADPDVRTCGAIARTLGYTTTHVLAAAGLIPGDEDTTPPTPPRALTQREALAALAGDDTAAQDAVIALLRALGKWAP